MVARNRGIGNRPGVPVLSKSVERSVPILKLAERPLVDNVGVPRVVEQTGRDPWLHKHQQCVKIRSKRFLTSKTSHPPKLTPRTIMEKCLAWYMRHNRQTYPSESRRESRH